MIMGAKGFRNEVPVVRIAVAALGLLLGVSVVRGLLRDEGARRRVDKAVARLAPVQLVLGLTAMGVGVVFTLMQMAV